MDGTTKAILRQVESLGCAVTVQPGKLQAIKSDTGDRVVAEGGRLPRRL